MLEHGAAHRVVARCTRFSDGERRPTLRIARASRIFETPEALPELGQTLLTYGRFRSADAPDEGRCIIERAREIFERIEAPGWRAEADAALRGG